MDRIQYASLNECWLWLGPRVGTYGRLSVRSHSIPAHRLAYQLWVGDIPAGYEVDHLCYVRTCVNPAHLEAVTKTENLRRMNEHRGSGLDTCRRCGSNEWQTVHQRNRKPHRRCGECNRRAYYNSKVPKE